MGSKRKKITEVEKFYVVGNLDKMTDRELADKIVCSIGVISEIRLENTTYIAPNPVVVAQPLPTVVEPEPPVQKDVAPVYTGPRVRDLMGRNKRYGATVMTPAAAEVADETKAINKNFAKESSKYQMDKVVHRPLG